MQRPGWTPVLSDIAQSLASINDPDAVVTQVLKLIQDLVPYHRCALLEAHPILSRAITVAPTPEDLSEIFRLRERLDALLHILRGDSTEGLGEPLSAPDRSHLAVPISGLGEVIGLLYVERFGPDYDAEHLAFLSIVASQLGGYLTTLRVESEKSTLLDQREEDLQFLQMFVAMLGHDLRNPLAAIRLVAEVLNLEQDKRINEPAGRILNSADRMAEMVDQLLDLTRIRLASGIPIDKQKDVDLGALCRQAIDEIEIAAPGEQLVHLNVSGNPVGKWDGDRLLQVISNLVGNAVTHAERDGSSGPTVTVTVDGEERDVVCLKVHNQGAIPRELLPKIFEPFRGRSENDRDSEGLGLGLFIVKHIVEAHGGEISVDSSPASGTTFSAFIPRAD